MLILKKKSFFKKEFIDLSQGNYLHINSLNFYNKYKDYC